MSEESISVLSNDGDESKEVEISKESTCMSEIVDGEDGCKKDKMSGKNDLDPDNPAGSSKWFDNDMSNKRPLVPVKDVDRCKMDEISNESDSDPIDRAGSHKLNDVLNKSDSNPMKRAGSHKLNDISNKSDSDPMEIAGSHKLNDVSNKSDSDPMEIAGSHKMDDMSNESDSDTFDGVDKEEDRISGERYCVEIDNQKKDTLNIKSKLIVKIKKKPGKTKSLGLSEYKNTLDHNMSNRQKNMFTSGLSNIDNESTLILNRSGSTTEMDSSYITESESDDECHSTISSSDTDDYIEKGSKNTSPLSSLREKKILGNTYFSHFESGSSTSDVMDSSYTENRAVSDSGNEIDQFTQKAVDNIMGKDLQEQIEKLVSGDILTCKICGKMYNDKGKFKFHVENHKKKKKHKCEICGRGFLDNNRLVCHMSSHSGDKLFACEICGKKLSQMSGIKRHMRVHTGEKPFKCGVCSKSFTTKGSLKVHMRLHTGEKPFKCGVCGNSFTARSTLWSHEKIHTGEKDLECKICGKHFTLNSTLKKHVLIHDETYNERFPCDICGKEYMARNSMQRHRKTHAMLEEKPFNCEVCGNKFAMQSSLRRHMEIHYRGDMRKEFPCEYCPKYFAYKSSVVLHMKRKHNLKGDGTPLGSENTGMFIVTNDDDRPSENNTCPDNEENSSEEEEEDIEDEEHDNLDNSFNGQGEITNNENEEFLYALDLVKKQMKKQFDYSLNNETSVEMTQIKNHDTKEPVDG